MDGDELAKIGFSDLRKALTPEGHLINPQDWDADMAAAISSFEVVTTNPRGKQGDNPIEYTHKIKCWDKKGALDSLARHLGMFNDKLAITPDDPLTEFFKAVSNGTGRIGAS